MLRDATLQSEPRGCDGGGSCFNQSLVQFEFILFAAEDCSHLPELQPKQGICCHLSKAGIENYDKKVIKMVNPGKSCFGLILYDHVSTPF